MALFISSQAYAISASEILEKGNVVHTFRNQNDGTMFAWVAYKKSYICILESSMYVQYNILINAFIKSIHLNEILCTTIQYYSYSNT